MTAFVTRRHKPQGKALTPRGMRTLLTPTAEELAERCRHRGCGVFEARRTLQREKLIAVLRRPCTVTELRELLLTALEDNLL